jgi:23S rRNA (uracil1939-C5)-methyltransferase
LLPEGSGEVTLAATETGLDVLIEGELKLDLFTREQLAAFADTHDLARLSWVRPGHDVEPVARRKSALIRFGKSGVEPPPGSFVQPTEAGEKAITALILAAIPPKGLVADLYAGCGSFTVPLAERGNPVHAVEGEELPLKALMSTAHQMGLVVTSETRDLARRPLLEHEMKPFKAVVFDPPRAGAIELVTQLALSGPSVVVAVSCNPNTLARDLKVLIEGGYRLKAITPIDQFPYTAHLECVAVLERV